MKTKTKDYSVPISTQTFSVIERAFIEILHSEYRDETVKNKVYAYAKIYNSSETYFVSDDYNTPEEAIADIKEQIQEYCNDHDNEVLF